LRFGDQEARSKSTLRRNSAHAAISDLVLKTSVGVRLEAGVDIADIRRLIDQFASETSSQDGDGFVGFLGVEDIPPDRRDRFLAALADLAAPSGHGSPTSALGLQQAIDRLHAERQAALEKSDPNQAHALLEQIEQLEDEKRQMLRRIGSAVPWGGRSP
jgi:hypothetical protein